MTSTRLKWWCRALAYTRHAFRGRGIPESDKDFIEHRRLTYDRLCMEHDCRKAKSYA